MVLFIAFQDVFALVIMILFVLPLSNPPGWLILKGRKSIGMAGLISRILAACTGTAYFLAWSLSSSFRKWAVVR